MQIFVLSPVNQRGLVDGDPKPELHIGGVIEQMFNKVELIIVINLAIADASRLPSP